MKLLIALLTLLIMLAFISGSIADYWSSSVGTDTSTWSIYRQSDNVSFNLSSSVEGNVAPKVVFDHTCNKGTPKA